MSVLTNEPTVPAAQEYLLQRKNNFLFFDPVTDFEIREFLQARPWIYFSDAYARIVLVKFVGLVSFGASHGKSYELISTANDLRIGHQLPKEGMFSSLKEAAVRQLMLIDKQDREGTLGELQVDGEASYLYAENVRLTAQRRHGKWHVDAGKRDDARQRPGKLIITPA